MADRFKALTNPLPKPGDVVDGWTIGAQIGSGSMFLVFEAERGDERGVLKLMHPKLVVNQQVINCVRMEHQATSAIRHPSIPRAIAHGTHNKLPYVIQQRVTGQNLFKYLTTVPEIPRWFSCIYPGQ